MLGIYCHIFEVQTVPAHHQWSTHGNFGSELLCFDLANSSHHISDIPRTRILSYGCTGHRRLRRHYYFENVEHGRHTNGREGEMGVFDHEDVECEGGRGRADNSDSLCHVIEIYRVSAAESSLPSR
jgi:hypothetical protein